MIIQSLLLHSLSLLIFKGNEHHNIFIGPQTFSRALRLQFLMRTSALRVSPSLADAGVYSQGSDFPSWCQALPLGSRGMGASANLTIKPSAASLGQAPPR